MNCTRDLNSGNCLLDWGNYINSNVNSLAGKSHHHSEHRDQTSNWNAAENKAKLTWFQDRLLFLYKFTVLVQAIEDVVKYVIKDADAIEKH